MSSIPEFIESLGGAAVIAKSRGKPYTTVASWKARNAIPVEEWPGLVGLAKQRGVSADYETLVNLHTAQRVPS